jgi:hypothetical protein
MWVLDLNVEKWATDKVVDWAKGIVRQELAEILGKQEVDGKSLLTLTEEKLMQDGFPRGPAVSLTLAIEGLRLTREQIFGKY